MKCLNPECICLEIKSSDTFCPWCGQRCDVHLEVEEKESGSEENWVGIARFFHEERPTLRLKLQAREGFIWPEELPEARSYCKWMRVGEWYAVDSCTYCADLQYLSDLLPAEAKKRSYTANFEVVWPDVANLSARVSVYPRPSYGLEVERDSQGVVRLLKDENGSVTLNFRLLRFGPTTGMRIRVHVPGEYLAASHASKSADSKESKAKGKGKALVPNLWNDAGITSGVGSARSALPAKTENSGLWDKQSLEVNWLDSAGSKRRAGQITYCVRGGDSEVYHVKFTVTYRARISADAWRPYEFTQELGLPVRVVGRPILKVLGSVGRTSWSVLTNRSEDFSIPVELTNGGRDSKLEILGVKLGTLPPGLKVELSGALVEGQTIVNVDGQAKPMTVLLRLLEVPPVGNYNFDLIFTYVDPSDVSGRRSLQYVRLIGLRVGQPCPLPGSVLAVDFGTSSSCVAALGLGTSQEMVVVEDDEMITQAGGDRYSLSSLALYAKDKVTLGEAARLLSYRYPLALLESPKREIGKREFFEILPAEQSWTKIAVDVVVSEFYRALVRRAQDSVVSIQRSSNDNWNCCNFENLAVSHPSRFNFSQKQILGQAATRAFKEVFGDIEVRQELVQEPLAAALAYVSDASVQGNWHNVRSKDDITYTMLVYDCGGGTTDLCCLEVHSQRHRAIEGGCTDYAQLTEEQRQRLLPQALRLLDPKAEQRNIDSWASLLRSYPDWLWAWSDHAELQSIPGDSEALVRAIVACANEVQSRDSYTVDVCIKGASGDPTFGGTNVTEEIAALVRESFPGLIIDERGEDDKKVKARRNLILLQRFAEQLKCHVSDKDDDFIATIINGKRDGTLVTVNGPVYDSELKKQLSAVNRGLYKRLRYSSGGSQTRIANLGDECLALSQRCFGTKSPDVILMTGRGSQWPGIRESLELKFSGVPVLLLGDGNAIKHCVSKGAGVLALVKSGAKLAGGPGVHIVDVHEDVYTTASLCLQSGPQMAELIGAGSSFDENGKIVGERSWRLVWGENKISVTVYRSDVPGTCQISGDMGQREGVMRLDDFILDIPENSGNEATIALELYPVEEPGCAELRIALVANKTRIYGTLANGETGLKIMILNK